MIGVDLLEEADYRVIEAGNADEALKALEGDPLAVAVLVTNPVWSLLSRMPLRRRLASADPHEAARGSQTARRSGGIRRVAAPRGCAAVDHACDRVSRHGIA